MTIDNSNSLLPSSAKLISLADERLWRFGIIEDRAPYLVRPPSGASNIIAFPGRWSGKPTPEQLESFRSFTDVELTPEMQVLYDQCVEKQISKKKGSDPDGAAPAP